MVTEDDLQALLDENPGDHQTRLVLADFLQDRDDPRAEGYRAMGTLRLAPRRNREHRQWSWMEIVTGRMSGNQLKSYWYWHLVKTWWEAPQGFHKSWSGWRAWYPTRREAEDRAATAWLKVDESKRQRDLREVPK